MIGLIEPNKLMKATCKHCETDHPESPTRLVAIYNAIDKMHYAKIMHVDGRYATINELLIGHSGKYVQAMIQSQTNSELRANLADNSNSIYLNKYSFGSASYAVGSTLELLSRIIVGQIKYGFSLVRPPGHHAFRDYGSGFCIFNNVAISALCARFRYSRVFVLDFDVHHGDGTESILHGSDIKFITIQRDDHGKFYPSSGMTKKLDNILSIGLNIPQTNDSYIHMFNNLLHEIREFHPEIILISAGFDGVIDDPLGGWQLLPTTYKWICSQLKLFNVPLLFVLEGGYNCERISECVTSIIDELSH